MSDTAKADNRELDPKTWVDHYGDYLFRYAFSRLRDGDAAEEVVQETFVAALRHVDQFAGKGSERAWLLGILKRKVIDFIRARNRTTSLMDEDASDPIESLFDRNGSWQRQVRTTVRTSLDSLEREEFWRILNGCLDGLPGRQADVFVLREMDEQSTENICEEMEISPSNLWVILHRARLQLSNCMKRRWHQEKTDRI